MTQFTTPSDELSVMFARVSGLLLSRETVCTAVRLVTSMAVDVLPGTVGAGLTVANGDGSWITTAASDVVVERADKLQYTLGEGPCLTAWMERLPVRIDDIRVEQRWPKWSHAVGPLGLRSVLSTPLVAGDGALGALKVYGAEAGVYDARAEHLLAMLAAQAAIPLANLRAHEAAEQVSAQLRDSLRGRDVINMAKGVIISHEGVDEHTALAVLVETSRREHKPLRQVAEALVRTTVRRLR